MTEHEIEYGTGQVFNTQLRHAQVGLKEVTLHLWEATGYNQNVLEMAIEAFPTATERRSDINDQDLAYTPEEELWLREAAAKLGPGRARAESLGDLGVERVDGEVIEGGQLHKVATEFAQALGSGQTSPIILFASDRKIPMWKKNKETKQEDAELGFDAERLSTVRLLHIGGHEIDEGDFFYRAGQFDADENRKALLEAAAPEAPATEYAAVQEFILETLRKDDRGEATIEDLAVSFDPMTGELSDEVSGQVRRLGNLNGRDIFLTHVPAYEPGSKNKVSTVKKMVILADIIARLTGNVSATMSYYTSSTYKPSRVIEGLRASLIAGQAGRQHQVVVPTYGYRDLTRVTGEKPEAQKIPQIVAELNNTARAAKELSEEITVLTANV